MVQENGIGRGTVPLLGLEPRVFRLEGGRAIQLRHTGKILSVERFELSHPEISRPKRDALDRSAKLTKNVVCKIRTCASYGNEISSLTP